MPQARYRCLVAGVSIARRDGEHYHPATEKTVSVAHLLSKRLGSRVRVVTVFEPTHAPPWGDLPIPKGIVVSRAEIYRALRLGRESALRQMKAEVTQIADRLGDVEAVGAVVEAYDAAQGILSEAVSRAADLVVVGTSRPSYRGVYRGFSTALSLMSSSPVPVLVVPEEADFKLDRPKLKLVVADDLLDGSVAVIRHAASLASQLGPCEITHLHVLEHSPASFFTSIDDRDVVGACETEMRKRSVDFMKLLPAGSEYHSEVRTGDVVEVIHAVIEEHLPDIIFFGRHRTLSLRPLMLGRMTANAMLELKRPVIVVPQDR